VNKNIKKKTGSSSNASGLITGKPQVQIIVLQKRKKERKGRKAQNKKPAKSSKKK
jgi:hypothetical protein